MPGRAASIVSTSHPPRGRETAAETAKVAAVQAVPPERRPDERRPTSTLPGAAFDPAPTRSAPAVTHHR
jgi:hypothetical protein